LLVAWLAIAGVFIAATAMTAGRADLQEGGRTVVLSLESQIFGNRRAIRVHLPIGYDRPEHAQRHYPVLFLNDGFAVFSPKSWDAPSIVDALTRDRVIPPIILVGIDNAASIPGSTNPSRDRTNEFLPFPDPLEPEIPAPQGTKYPEFVVREVLPLVESQFRTSSDAALTAIGGSSYGGIAALYTLIRHPTRFGRLLLESTPTFLFGGRLIAEAAALDPPPHRVYIGIGTKETEESVIQAAAARMSSSLEAVSPTLTLVNRVPGATHSPAAWRARLPTALRFLFASGE
jgi:enterochelin esterase-like enzyme